MKFPQLAFAAGSLLVALTSNAQAVMRDGRLDAEYGAALSTQTNLSDLGNATFPSPELQALASELDQAYVFIARDTLFVLLSGNLGVLGGSQPGKDHHQFIFINNGGGGQNQVVPGFDGTDLFRVGGVTFDAGFNAGYALVSSFLGSNLNEEFIRLPSGLPASGYILGSFANSTPQDSALGGSNPDGIAVGIDNSNLAGVAAGCFNAPGGGSSGAGVTTGIEWAVPLAAIGHPTGCLRICAFLFDGNFVSNQVLGPVPVGSCSLGVPGAVNFANLAGDQFFSVCPASTPARSATWGQLKLRYR